MVRKITYDKDKTVNKIKTMNTTTEKLKSMAAQLREMFPSVLGIVLDAWNDGQVSVTLHGAGDYAQSSQILRQHSYHDRDKQIVDCMSPPWSIVSATESHFEIKAFASGLPPSCRLVKKLVQIPKQETRDTGEFIEVERLEVVCGNGGLR